MISPVAQPAGEQALLFGQVQPNSPAAAFDADCGRRSLDELFSVAQQYRTTESFHELMRFVVHFRFYAPFNAMLLHIQMPGAVYVAPALRWLRDYKRTIKPEARPLVILQPMGPVMFVFDVSDTDPGEGAPPLPREAEKPFEVRSGWIGRELERTIENATRDGIRVTEQRAGSQGAGSMQVAQGNGHLSFQVTSKPDPEYVEVKLRYELLINSKLSKEAKYATLLHELAHLYCGHLGTPNGRWWPDRRGLAHDVQEFEAESVTHLVCNRLGIDNPSAEYLASYIKDKQEVPHISLECIMKCAGLIERMGRERLKPRKDKQPRKTNRTAASAHRNRPAAGGDQQGSGRWKAAS